MDIRYFTKKLAEWYLQHQRNLPWRSTSSPYPIWLSEVILQQTRVSQGKPYYQKFLRQFPTVSHLANASERDVLRTWQGLGYYSRARNLHACAKKIMREYNGTFPRTYAELLTLPGIGPYTAAAISSICFQEPRAVVDGNVYRVLARIFGIKTPINSPAGIRKFRELAQQLLDVRDPARHNQALMEFGALHCTPKTPDCAACPFASSCVAFQANLQSVLPVKVRAQRIKTRHFHYFVFTTGRSLLMRERTEKDIWKGLYDFYLVESTSARSLGKILHGEPLLARYIRPETVVSSPKYTHLLSHQRIIATFHLCPIPAEARAAFQPLQRIAIKKVNALPKPVLISRFLDDAQLL